MFTFYCQVAGTKEIVATFNAESPTLVTNEAIIKYFKKNKMAEQIASKLTNGRPLYVKYAPEGVAHDCWPRVTYQHYKIRATDLA
jgi:hypothetical protein